MVEFLSAAVDGQRFQVAQLQGLRMAGQDLGRLAELVRRLQLAFGMDHLGPTLAFGLGLARGQQLSPPGAG